jgi:hypothetical protein
MEKNRSTPLFAALGRLIWMVLGPGFLAIITMHIYLYGTGWHTTADYVFFATLGVMILGRSLEVLGGVPLNSVGEPATRKDFYEYVAFVLGAGLVIWIIANALGNHGRA